MATDVLLVRNGKALGACDPLSAEAIEAMANGEQVIATLRRARNPKHHRKMFALLTLIARNSEDYLDAEDLLDDIKIRIGYCRTLTRPNGTTLTRTRSVSFANMAQDKFEAFYNKAMVCVLTEILPGLDRRDLEREVEAVLAGRDA